MPFSFYPTENTTYLSWEPWGRDTEYKQSHEASMVHELYILSIQSRIQSCKNCHLKELSYVLNALSILAHISLFVGHRQTVQIQITA